ncbi:hypothetical protein E2C01_018247 [Portunus trituberculatus]|uniref:Uncharacterized protein n=1 Tax=Portunus trituberculatus TaxID=210409 RepID=A0A5B7DV11_PORTR|nr:hypothetical protein [Portunus trituberculatus]
MNEMAEEVHEENTADLHSPDIGAKFKCLQICYIVAFHVTLDGTSMLGSWSVPLAPMVPTPLVAAFGMTLGRSSPLDSLLILRSFGLRSS